MKAQEIDHILTNAISTSPVRKKKRQADTKVHLLRAIFVAIDLTSSMSDKDFKPTRLSISLKMVKQFIQKVKDATPLCKFLVAIVENQLCKPLQDFGYDETELIEKINNLTVKANCGHFSLENTLSVALDYFDTVPNTFNKELIIIQSSPYTKDYRDVYDTISIFQKSKISVNIISLTGSTFVFSKLADSCRGQYKTVGSEAEFHELMTELAKPPRFNPDRVLKKLVKMSFVRREYTVSKKCFCHGVDQKGEYFVCGVCLGVLCGKMPMECPICLSILVFPSDLFRHITE